MTAPAAPRTTREDLTKYAWLAIAAALATIGLKTTAWWVSGSVGLLSDAAESVVNLVAAIVALIALKVAARPADETHAFGHTKAEYFSAIVEGAMIFVAAAFIIQAAVQRLLHPRELEQVGLGLGISVVAAVLNGVVGGLLIRKGRQHRSITLEADGKHLMTDVVTSVGVVLAVGLVWLTGWLVLDPIIAIAVGLNILIAGWKLISVSVNGLMDKAAEPEIRDTVDEVLAGFTSDTVHFHAVRTRESGHRTFVSMHVLVPGAWSVQQGHDLAEDVEAAVRTAVPDCEVSTHVEPLEDPRSYEPEFGAEPPA